MRHTLFILCILIASTNVVCYGQESQVQDSINQSKPGLIQRVINYFNETNKTEITSRPNFSFIGGPHYSSDSKFGLGLVVAGLYSTNPTDNLLPPSNISIKFDATTAAHFELKLSGEHIAPADKYRINYSVAFSSIETKFWGVGMWQCKNDDNESDYKYLAYKVRADFGWRIGKHIYAGPMVAMDYVNARDYEKPELWEGLPSIMMSYGAGVTARLDTRDSSTEPMHGWLVRVDQLFNISRASHATGHYAVNEFTVANYQPLWKGATLASRLHGKVTWGDTPWGMMPYIGGSYDMRGYFEGRYRAKNEIDLCVELRQHVWRRNGVVVWGGVASLFNRFVSKNYETNNSGWLPNWGIGYRWQFKQRMNVRVDFGFGKGQSGIIFNLNEAF